MCRLLFFVTRKNVAAHPDFIAQILEPGHTTGNHTYSQNPLILLKLNQRLKEEIIKTQVVMDSVEPSVVLAGADLKD